MTEHKFANEEIIRALEYHSDPSKPCVYKCVYGDQRYCGSKMAKDALDLIKRQKAEIERLNLLIDGAKTKTVGKFVPRDYIQLTIDDMESET